jgi:hypothetical protein
MVRGALALGVALLIAGCGSSHEETKTKTRPPANDQEAVAQTANRVFEALTSSDGKTACGLMTREAQAMVGRTGNCEDAVYGGAAVSSILGVLTGGSDVEGPFKPGRVQLSPDGRTASAYCDQRNTWALQKVHGVWKVSLPACNG